MPSLSRRAMRVSRRGANSSDSWGGIKAYNDWMQEGHCNWRCWFEHMEQSMGRDRSVFTGWGRGRDVDGYRIVYRCEYGCADDEDKDQDQG
jgi:hypothetical protein